VANNRHLDDSACGLKKTFLTLNW